MFVDLAPHRMDDDVHLVDRVDPDAVEDHDFHDPNADEVAYGSGARAAKLRRFARAGEGGE